MLSMQRYAWKKRKDRDAVVTIKWEEKKKGNKQEMCEICNFGSGHKRL